MTPTEYRRKVLDNQNGEEIKVESLEARLLLFSTSKRCDLEQMNIRHSSFMSAFTATTSNQRITLFY